MKKIISLFLVILMVSAMVLSISAADPQTKIYDAYKANFPENYQPYYNATVQAVLNQVPVTDEQADQVIAIIKEGKNYFKTDKGISLSEYTKAEADKAVDLIKRICKVMNVSYKFISSDSPSHVGDIIIQLYYNGNLITALDNEHVKVTGGIETTSCVGLVLAGLVAVMGCASVVTLKKRTF